MNAIRERNFSPREYLLGLGRAMKPRHAFRQGSDFAQWRAEALGPVLDTLGPQPDPVPLNPVLLAEFDDGGMICQRWVIDVQDHLSVMVVVNRPRGVSGRLPGILCWAGHSAFGKEAVMGNRSSQGLRDYVEETGLEYGRHMAETGEFVTFGIDWMGQGDLNDAAKPNNRPVTFGMDWNKSCDLLYLNATLMGFTTLGLNVAHARRLLDFASSLDFIDSDRIGAMGESTGGTLTVWTALADERIRAAEVICYSDSFPDFALRDYQYCGTQITPGLFALVDVSDLHGLIAPRPLLLDIGAYDPVFRLESSIAAVDRVEAIYSAAGAGDVFQRQVFPAAHGWQPGLSAEFFRKHLVVDARRLQTVLKEH